MKFESLLYRRPVPDVSVANDAPEFFRDAGLDTVVKEMLKGHEGSNIEQLFYSPLADADDIHYRQKIFLDLRNPKIEKPLRQFSESYRTILSYLESDISYMRQKEGLFLYSALLYCRCLRNLLDDISSVDLVSEGLSDFRDYLSWYLSSGDYMAFQSDAETVSQVIEQIVFQMTIKGDTITVSRRLGSSDYSTEVEKAFERFRKEAGPLRQESKDAWYSRGHVEASVLELVARLYRKEFDLLHSFYIKHRNFLDQSIDRFYRDIQFYFLYLEYTRYLEGKGLSFCLPLLVSAHEGTYCREGFDMALAAKLAKENRKVVTNDFQLAEGEEVIVVTGPNQGGKTTFARQVVQLHYLTRLGVPVPGREAAVRVADFIFSHFERGENVENLRGKLEDDLVRIRDILSRCTDKSLVIINEMLSSTSTKDAMLIGSRIIEKIVEKRCMCIYVTFVDELAKLRGVVSYTCQVALDEPQKRTFKILRGQPIGVGHALALAKKYGLTYSDILKRVKQ